VIQGFKQGVGFPLQNLEIYTKSGFVQLFSGDGNFNLPIMTMQVFAIALVIDKAMSGCK
jgi:hypothetical protein